MTTTTKTKTTIGECGHPLTLPFTITNESGGPAGLTLEYCSPACAIDAMKATQECQKDEAVRELAYAIIRETIQAAKGLGGSDEEIRRTAKTVLREASEAAIDHLLDSQLDDAFEERKRIDDMTGAN